jgi:hypothetical protein
VAELADAIGTGTWAIAGGQMVTIHAARLGLALHRTTADADVVVDVRSGGRSAMTDVSDRLLDAGFTAHHSLEGVTRYERGEAKIDLLAPEGVGRPVATTESGHAVQAPGATQALNRSEVVSVNYGDGQVTVRCPTAFGALVAKAAAATEIDSESAGRRMRHQQDFVVLAVVLADDGIAGVETTKTDRRRITRAARVLLADPHHQAWNIDRRADAEAVLRRFCDG